MKGLVSVTRERQMGPGNVISWHEYTFEGIDAVTGGHVDYGPYPGVTTHQNKLAKYLETYHLRLGIMAALAERDELALRYSADGEKALVDDLLVAAREAGNVARDRGSRIHAAIAEFVQNEPWEGLLEVGDMAYMDTFRRDFIDALKPTFINIEFMVFSETQRYGGTADMLVEIDGERWLLDTKTGSSVYGETGLQLAALSMADFAGRPGDPVQYEIPKHTRYGVLHIRPRSTKLLEAHITPHGEFKAFLNCRDLYEWTRDRSRRIFT